VHFRILKTIATSGFLTALECTKFVFGRGSARTPLVELTALPRLPNWFKGDPTSKGKGEKNGERRGGVGRGEGTPP